MAIWGKKKKKKRLEYLFKENPQVMLKKEKCVIPFSKLNLFKNSHKQLN